MTDFTIITDEQIDPESPVTSELMTALRDNVVAFAGQSVGAPVSNIAYDIQVFTASGTWTKPADALSTDIVQIWCVGGGGGGSKYNVVTGGAGAGGALIRYSMADVVSASYTVTVGAGGAGRVPNSDGSGASGGSTSFGTAGTPTTGILPVYVLARGGQAGQSSAVSSGGEVSWGTTKTPNNSDKVGFTGGDGETNAGVSSIYGGGGGGNSSGSGTGGFSAYAGRGGYGVSANTDLNVVEIDGAFPGGGGGSCRTVASTVRSGNGADGICVVMCYRNFYGS